MKHFFLAILAIFFGLNSLTAQEVEITKTQDSLDINIVEESNVDTKDEKLNFWQLSEHKVYETYPDSLKNEVDFIKGKEFLELKENGEYFSILNNQFNKGLWLQNNNLIVFKQKVPSTVDIYYEVIKHEDNVLI
ncbi:hypothetical protein [Winogradskyella pulchriflava]|uniref:Uncharacterized protein n=1 Tax=Winogradskyella pulchriflava TaxID=1110688 RepID=A0ABV6Q6K4_9FLAO